MLEAPDDIFSFAFNPIDPNIIAGGCINGQVVLWDISKWEERIKNPRGDHRDKDLFIVLTIYILFTVFFHLVLKIIEKSKPGFEDDSYFLTPRIRYCALSSLEHGHNQPITDIIWIPDHFEVRLVSIKPLTFLFFKRFFVLSVLKIDRMGFPTESKNHTNSQLITAAKDK